MATESVQEEQLDVYDEYSNFLGYSLPKSEVHARGAWHTGAHLWITDGNENVALQRRDAGKDILPGVLDISVAGHTSAWEDADGRRPDLLRQAMLTAIREGEEELGIALPLEDFTSGKIRFIGITRSEMLITPQKGGRPWWHRVFNFNFVACLPDLNLGALTLEKHAVQSVEWMDINKLEQDLSDPDRRMLYRIHPPDNDKLWSGVFAEMRVIARNRS